MISILTIALLTLLFGELGLFISIIFNLNITDYFIKFIVSIIIVICIILIMGSIEIIV